MTGVKHDDGKLDYSLIDDEAEAEMVAVLTFGATKYARGNWRSVELDRYVAALRRHLAAWRSGEEIDPETGLHHLAHLACCAHFLLGIELASTPSFAESRPTRLSIALDKAKKIRAAREEKAKPAEDRIDRILKSPNRRGGARVSSG